MTPERQGRYALVVATARYADPKLRLLRAPAADAERLARVLGDPERGDFDVQVVLDESHSRVTRAIASFFRDRRLDDLLLLHFSCHGVKDERGDLYLAAADTEVDLLSATGVSATWLGEQIDRSRSRRTVVLLDCCFSGSFPLGMRARGDAVDAPGHLQGRGRAIITASNAMEYAYEGDHLEGEGRPSVFTGAVVEGLETGEADLDGDRLISVDDLYNYVYDRVREATPNQTPLKKSELEGPLYLARSPYRPPAPVEAELVPAVPATAVEAEPDAAPMPIRSQRRTLAAAAVVAVAVVAASAFALVRADGEDGATTIPDDNVVTNPSFEQGTAGWAPDDAVIASEPADDAPDGTHVARVTFRGVSGSYSIDDQPNSVASSRAGRTYAAVAWVKATPSTDGEPVCLVLRERAPGDADAGRNADRTSAGVTASADEYRPVRLSHTATASGNSIGIHLTRQTTGDSTGEAFLADAVTLAEGAAVEPSPECPF